ncbi:F-box protein At5g49610 [Linum perenne]
MARLSPSLCINDVLSLPLLVEVLVRVPLKDVFRSKCVCKLWLSCLQDNYSYVGSRFLQQRISELPLNKDEEQLIPVVWNQSEMLLVQQPSWYNVTASKFSLDFLPFYDVIIPPDGKSIRNVVLASDNGLLVCSPNNSQYAEYYICNPLTRQWLALPLPPLCQEHDTGVGLICDPLYNVNDDLVTVNDQFSIKLVRLLIIPDWYGNHQIHAEMFSSQTGWSAMQLADGIACFLRFDCPPITYKGKIHWLLNDCDFLIYDPETNEFPEQRYTSGTPPEELYIPGGPFKTVVGFDVLSICKRSFWIGQTLNARVRVFMLANGIWRLEHDVDTYHEMDWSSSSVKQKVCYDIQCIKFWTMHPNDSMIAYMSVGTAFLECNFRDRTMEVLSEGQSIWSNVGQSIWSNVVTLSLPLWPTPLPALSTSI